MKKLSKKDLLFEYIKEKKILRTSDIVKWGLANFDIRADRNARQLAEEGKIRRMTDEEQTLFLSKIGCESSVQKVWVLI